MAFLDAPFRLSFSPRKGGLPQLPLGARCESVSQGEGEDVFEVLDRLEEGCFSLGHYKVDGVEVALAAEAASEVPAVVYRAVKATALGTAEGEPAAAPPGRYPELEDHGDNRSVVSQSSEVLGWNHVNPGDPGVRSTFGPNT